MPYRKWDMLPRVAKRARPPVGGASVSGWACSGSG
jgi:hypothetical protein